LYLYGIIKNSKRKNTLMKKLIFAILMASTVLFAACESKTKDDEKKPDDPTIDPMTITVTNVENLPDDAASIAVTLEPGGTIATSSITNGGFAVTLPAEPDAKFLIDPTTVFAMQGITLTASDPEAKTTTPTMEFLALDASGNELDDIYYGSETQNYSYMYATKDVILTASGTMEGIAYTIDLQLTAGWNIYVMEESATGASAKTGVTIANAKWYCDTSDGTISYLEVDGILELPEETAVIKFSIMWGGDNEYPATFTGTGFSFTFPETLSANYLYPLDNDYFDIPLEVSDPNAKISDPYLFFAEDAEGYLLSDIEYGKRDSSTSRTFIIYIYSTSDVSAYGVSDNPDWQFSVDIQLKAGWNEVHYILGYSNNDGGLSTNMSDDGYQWQCGLL
jgi:hypothetical protein